VFDFSQPLIVAGFALGLASSLHCLGMCSGIATSICFIAAPASPKNYSRTLYRGSLIANGGRIAGYVFAGAVVGGLGASVFGAFDRGVFYIVLRWAAAVSLGWIGLSMAGLMPLPPSLGGIGERITQRLALRAAGSPWPKGATIFAAGCVWGLFPCAMTYAALFYAMLAGSWTGGAVVMLGFGLGTTPAVLSAGLGLPLLRQKVRTTLFRNGLGLAIALLGIATAIVPPEKFAALCGHG
jgi:sulfite exporter TauE/SafE